MLVAITVDVDKLKLYRMLTRTRELGIDISLIAPDGVEPLTVTPDSAVSDICEYFAENEI